MVKLKKERSEKMKSIIKFGNMYVYKIEIENYSEEVTVEFNSKIEYAKKFNENTVSMFIDILTTLFGNVEFSILAAADEPDEEGE